MTPLLAATTTLWVWYVSRATGIVSLLLLTGSVLLGILTSVRWASDRWPRFTTTLLHRNLSLLAVVFLALHVGTVIIDGFAPIGWRDAFIPFASPYRSFWLGLGTIAFDLVLTLVITSLLRNRIGPRLWRGIHWLAYACWPVALVHGMGTGTDTSTPLLLAVDAACIIAVLLALWWRVGPQVVQRAAVRGSVVAGTLAASLLLAGWLFDGPLASNWARRAGTPAALLARGASAETASAAPSTPAGPVTQSQGLDASFAANFSGSVTRSSAANGAETVQFDAPLGDGSGARLAVVLQVTDRGGALAVRSGTATITSSTNTAEFTGTITGVDNGTLFATPSADSPTARSLAVEVDRLDLTGGRVSGVVSAARQATGSGDG
ncbi:MAG: ferric reductase-like transmembrane domain-containing protein [Acidimicrobiia bacterium]